MAYDPSKALGDGTIPAGGFLSHVTCVAAINTLPVPPVAQAGIALLMTDAEKDAAYGY